MFVVSTHQLYPQDTRVKMAADIGPCFPGDKITLVENHWPHSPSSAASMLCVERFYQFY